MSTNTNGKRKNTKDLGNNAKHKRQWHASEFILPQSKTEEFHKEIKCIPECSDQWSLDVIADMREFTVKGKKGWHITKGSCYYVEARSKISPHNDVCTFNSKGGKWFPTMDKYILEFLCAKEECQIKCEIIIHAKTGNYMIQFFEIGRKIKFDDLSQHKDKVVNVTHTAECFKTHYVRKREREDLYQVGEC